MKRPGRTAAAAALAALTLAGCGVRAQNSPEPIDRPTPETTATPSVGQVSPSPSSPPASSPAASPADTTSPASTP